MLLALCCTGPCSREWPKRQKTGNISGLQKRQSLPDPASEQPLYIVGYNNGLEITDVLD